MQDAGNLGGQFGFRLGAPGLAVLAATSGRIRHARVGSERRISLTRSYGTFVFNGLVTPVLFPPSVQLSRESELEATGALPAAGAQSRAGYDIVARDD